MSQDQFRLDHSRRVMLTPIKIKNEDGKEVVIPVGAVLKIMEHQQGKVLHMDGEAPPGVYVVRWRVAVAVHVHPRKGGPAERKNQVETYDATLPDFMLDSLSVPPLVPNVPSEPTNGSDDDNGKKESDRDGVSCDG